MTTEINFTLNKNEIKIKTEENWTLLYLLREKLELTGTKEGCGSGECGACTVLIDGIAINSCIYPSIEANNRKILTIEGLANQKGDLDNIQKAFIEQGGIQCGFCTPGMIMSSKALLNENQNPTIEEIKTALSGNICRCTGYTQIIESVQNAAKKNIDSTFL